jgi:pentatricopeptide repeat protein
MKREKVEVSAVTYGCLINACIKNDKIEKAFELFQEMNKAGIALNIILYTTLIKAYSRTKNVNKVLEIFEKMKEDKNNQPNNITYNSVLDCLVRNDYLEAAEKVLSELSSHMTLKPDIISFSTLIKGYLSKKDLGKPIELLKMMEILDIKPDEVLLNSLLDGCDKMSEYKHAVQIFTHVRKFIYPSLMSFSIMMKVYGKLGNYEESKKLMSELRKNKEKISLIIYTCYMRTCFNSKKPDEAMDIFKEITSKRLNPDEVTFKTLIIGFSNMKCVNYIYTALDASLTTKKALKYEVYEKALNCISSTCNEEEIIQLIQRIKSLGVSIDPRRYVRNYKATTKIKEVPQISSGFDYLIQNYKYKNDYYDDNKENSKKPNQEKRHFNNKEVKNNNKFEVKQLNDENIINFEKAIQEKSTKPEKESENCYIKTKAFKGEKKPFGVISTSNSNTFNNIQGLTKGFERGTKVSTGNQQLEKNTFIRELNPVKNSDKPIKFNRF